MGILPVPEHGQDGHGTGSTWPMKKTRCLLHDIDIRQGAYLPHWTRQGSIYAVNFRLADSLPQSVIRAWDFERRDIVKRAQQMSRSLTPVEEMRLDELFSEKVERYLDAGTGQCWMNRDEIAAVVADALLHFEGARYRLAAWCVMPNHVHTVVEPLPGYELPNIVHSWKSFTANQANRLLGRTGPFWQPEPYDHLIRDEEDFDRQVKYVLSNPVRAGLENWKWVGSGSL
jgi:REP element-mobilizing transposase RayT